MALAVLPLIAFLAVSVGIELVSSSARVTSVKFQKGLRLSLLQTTGPIDWTPGSDKKIYLLKWGGLLWDLQDPTENRHNTDTTQTSPRHLSKTSSRCLQIILKIFPRSLPDIPKISSKLSSSYHPRYDIISSGRVASTELASLFLLNQFCDFRGAISI